MNADEGAAIDATLDDRRRGAYSPELSDLIVETKWLIDRKRGVKKLVGISDGRVLDTLPLTRKEREEI